MDVINWWRYKQARIYRKASFLKGVYYGGENYDERFYINPFIEPIYQLFPDSAESTVKFWNIHEEPAPLNTVQ